MPREEHDYRQRVENRLTKLETSGRIMRWAAGIAATVLTGLGVGAFLLLRAAITAIGT